MVDFSLDPNTRQATIHLRHGGQVARSATLNGNTARYDANGVMIDYIIASPFGSSGCDLDGLPEHDGVREMLKFFDGIRSSR